MTIFGHYEIHEIEYNRKKHTSRVSPDIAGSLVSSLVNLHDTSLRLYVN
jgi:hypothetical protein